MIDNSFFFGNFVHLHIYPTAMAKTESQIIKDIDNGVFLPVYLFTGEEDYYIDRLDSKIEASVVPEESRDFDQTIVYGRDVTMAEVISMAQRLPMMSERQLIVVREAQDIGLKNAGKKKTAEWELLLKYLEIAPPSTVLVFCYRQRNRKKWDKRTKVHNAIDKCGVFYESKKLRDQELPAWIATHAREHGYAITERSATLMANCIGNNLSKVTNELEKLYAAKPQGGTITDNDVEVNIGISKDFNIFELQNAIGRRDVVKCNRIINHFAANPKENPIQLILPNLYNYFIKVMIYLQEPDKSNAAAAIGVSPYFLRDYETAANNYTLPKLASCIRYLHEADIKSKGMGNNPSTTSDGELLRELIFKIIH